MKKTSLRRATFLSIVVAAGLAAAPGTARAGFFEDLFGGMVPRTAAPTSDVEPPSGYTPRDDSYAPLRKDFHRPKKKVAAIDAKPVLQKTTDLMDDKTLRPGDAIMMRNGVHVYAGPEGSHHESHQFVALDNARHLSAKERDQLISIDMTRRGPLEYVASRNTVLQEGRSIGGQPIAKGYQITDARGRSIRYVGP